MKRAGIELRLFAEDCESVINDVPDQSNSAEKLLVGMETSASVRNLLARLSLGDRLVLEGKYIMELSDGELADLCGISKGSVRMRLSRARKHARDFLESEDLDNANR